MKNHFICAILQTLTASEMKLKLWQAQVMENSCMHFDTLAKHYPVNSEKYAAVLSILIKKFENRFQYLKKISFFFFNIFAAPFSVNRNPLLANFIWNVYSRNQDSTQIKILSCLFTRLS